MNEMKKWGRVHLPWWIIVLTGFIKEKRKRH